MIVLTTLRGEKRAINDELIERVEAAPDTRVVLTTGAHYVVAESVDEIVRLCQIDRAEVQVLARELTARSRLFGAQTSDSSGTDTLIPEEAGGDLLRFDRDNGGNSTTPGRRHVPPR